MATLFGWINRHWIRFKRPLALASTWKRLAVLGFFSTFFYTFMEWLFFVTKPSFMDPMKALEKVLVFLQAGYLICLTVGLAFGVLFILSTLPVLRKANFVFLWVAAGIPAFLLSVTFLLWFDNFTYTTFQFGIINSHRYSRLAYLLGYLAGLFFAYRWLMNVLARRKPVAWLDKAFLPTAAALVVLTLLTAWQIKWSDLSAPTRLAQAASSTPNIILLGGDGINADHMSVYGYERDTTPVMKELAQTSLLAENAFTNSGNTSGSIISMLTGKPVEETRVIYPPDILRGADAYEHLPGILKQLGYHSVEITLPHYIDAYALNLQGGFDVINEENIADQWLGDELYKLGVEDAAYFMTNLYRRALDRLLHIARIRNMPDPYKVVTTTIESRSDQQRVDELTHLIATSDRPLFVHVHLLVTHGGQFDPRQRVFSAGKDQTGPWMVDFYDDAILDFDTYVGEVISALKETGKLDQTILVIGSDHAQQYLATERIPLMMRFPNGQFAGRLKNNVENLSIAPTILDYMDLPIPGWMTGHSLLQGEPPATRPVFSSGVTNAIDVEGLYFHDLRKSQPPFFQFGWFNVVICQKYARLIVGEMTWQVGEIAGHTAPCAGEKEPRLDQMQRILIDHLASNGFDTSSITDELPVRNAK